MPKEMRAKRWRVRVFQDHRAEPCEYDVYATSDLDARLLAFALDGGFARSMTKMESGHVELALTYAEIVKST